jgi:hypothetical protein
MTKTNLISSVMMLVWSMTGLFVQFRYVNNMETCGTRHFFLNKKNCPALIVPNDLIYSTNKRLTCIQYGKALDDMIDFMENTLGSGSKVGNDQSNPMGLPIRQDGSFYELNAAAEDQKDIIAFCLNHLENSVKSEESDTFHFD